MPTIVTQIPAPIVTPADLPGFSGDVAVAQGIIAGVTAEFDGPNGLLGRCFGPQTLEYSTDYDRGCSAGCLSLPCPPIIGVLGVKFVGWDGAETSLVSSEYWLSGEWVKWRRAGLPAHGIVKISYRCGYDGTTTGAIPDQIKQAIILKAGLLVKFADGSAFLKADEVDGVGRKEFSIPEQVMASINSAANSLVAGLKVYRV